VLADGDGSRFVWIIDVLPNEVAAAVDGMVEEGVKAIKRTLERERVNSE
jgi:hypothetical protein